MATNNIYHRRLVAQSSAKACWICYKPSSTVLITPANDDWFHICPGHLTDRKFAIPQDEEDQVKKKRDAEIEKEIEAVKKEFEERMRKKLERRKQKQYEKDGKKDDKKEDKKKEDDENDESDEKAKEAKLKELEAKKEPEKAKVEGPRIFELQKSFCQMRMQKKRDLEAAKRTRERLRSPNTFPSVPTGALDGSKPGAGG